MKLKAFLFLSFFIAYLASGFFKNPIGALMIAALYNVGVAGLLLIYQAAYKHQNPTNWIYLFTGLSMICLAWLILESLFQASV